MRFIGRSPRRLLYSGSLQTGALLEKRVDYLRATRVLGMSWLMLILAAPVSLVRYLMWREPTVTWEMLEQNRRDEIQVKCMLESTRATCESCLDAYVYSMMQEQVRELEERHVFILTERQRLNARALQQGLTTDAAIMTHC